MSTFSFSDPEDYKKFRDILLETGFTAEGVLNTLGVKAPQSIRGNDLPILLRRTRQGTPLDILIRLFLIEVPVEMEAVRQAIRPLTLETLMQAGLVEISNSSVVASVKLLPYNDLFIAFDSPRLLAEGMRDYVMGIGSSSLTLANLVVRRHSGSTLDLGTGCGIQALLAARHSDYVLATDMNKRAVRLASFNAKLNNLSNIECVEGDLFDPALGKSFDLVISNPPFVISPETRYTYRDSGMEGDEICRRIVHEVPRFLNEGGYCQILCNWAEREGQDWRESMASWFTGTGCEAWVIRSETRDIETYASTWIRHTELHETSEYARRFDQWISYYEGKRISAVSAGMIIMRRSGNHPNWFRADDAPGKMLGPAGEAIVKGFELRDFLEAVQDDAALLETRLFLSPDVCLERQYAPSPEGWQTMSTKLLLNRGFAYTGEIDQYVADILIACNGQRRLADIFDMIAPLPDVAPGKLRDTFCAVVKRLIEHGFLMPEDLNN